MNRILRISAVLMACALLLSACGGQIKVTGEWTDDDGDRVTFMDDGALWINGDPYPDGLSLRYTVSGKKVTLIGPFTGNVNGKIVLTYKGDIIVNEQGEVMLTRIK